MGGGIYEHTRLTSLPDYLHFLDSDDYLRLDCIEKCLELAEGFDAQVVWHSLTIYNEQTQEMSSSNTFAELGLKEECIYDGLEIFASLPEPPSFSWAWCGMVHFDFLIQNNLRFIEGIESEDAPFGMQLFALSSKIIISHLELCVYRIRPNSISQHTLSRTSKSKDISFPESLSDLVCVFQTPYEVRHYNFAYSACIICLVMDEFLKNTNLSKEMKEILTRMIEHRAIYAFGGLTFGADPRDCRAMCKQLLPYSSKIRFGSRMAFYFPLVFALLKKLKNMFRIQS
ncbi:hypothetical protein BBW65_03920 [Helicobacter enhydrae]|uniref:Glycosyltransferase 2-like domain-containing protein n=1 Tax=Helicobacter enhydrae TaxID=222136 RepID=A0A1B1U5G6_9HELI|nr:hypothetical protein [Helicobacter enhydrae]ANV97998.1 hypothetical protein BBW65_03920 [Helicobacter enhydrae]